MADDIMDTTQAVPPPGSEAPPATGTPQEPPVDTGAAPEAAPTSPATVDWESQENPYRYSSGELSRVNQQLMDALQQVAVQGEAAQMKQAGASDEVIQQHMALRQREAALSQRESAAQEGARFEVARRIVADLKTAGVTVTQDELLKDSRGQDITNPQAMVAKADALYQERRKAATQGRKESGADKVPQTEGGGDSITTWAQAQKITKVSDLSDAAYERLVKGR